MAEQQQQHREQQQQQASAIPMEDATGATGAGDAESGGGAGAGIPDAELVERAGDAVTRGDVRQDREKLFPESEPSARPPGAQVDEDDEPRER